MCSFTRILCSRRGVTTEADLKLAKIPDRKPVKIALEIMPDLDEALARYAVAYEETYGKKEDAAHLIPFMLWAFLESDREFMRRGKGK